MFRKFPRSAVDYPVPVRCERDRPQAGCNATIPAGGNTSLGFQGSRTSDDAALTAFTLDGAICTTG
jgi:hypothetical protein